MRVFHLLLRPSRANSKIRPRGLTMPLSVHLKCCQEGRETLHFLCNKGFMVGMLEVNNLQSTFSGWRKSPWASRSNATALTSVRLTCCEHCQRSTFGGPRAKRGSCGTPGVPYHVGILSHGSVRSSARHHTSSRHGGHIRAGSTTQKRPSQQTFKAARCRGEGHQQSSYVQRLQFTICRQRVHVAVGVPP